MSRPGLAWSTQSPSCDLLLYSRNPRWLPADKQTVPTVRSSIRKIQITGNILSYNPFYNSWCHLSFFLPCRWFYPLHKNKADCYFTCLQLNGDELFSLSISAQIWFGKNCVCILVVDKSFGRAVVKRR